MVEDMFITFSFFWLRQLYLSNLIASSHLRQNIICEDMCVRVCVCVCVRERERERERGGDGKVVKWKLMCRGGLVMSKLWGGQKEGR